MRRMIAKLLVKYSDNGKDTAELLSGTAVAIALKITGIGLSYVFLYLLSKKFGPELVGVFSLSQSALIVCTMIGTFGFGNAIVRYSAQYASKGQWDILASVYKTMFIATAGISVVLAVLLFSLSEVLAVSLLKNRELAIAFKIIAVAIPFSALSMLNTEAIRGLKKIKISEFFRTVNISFWNLALFVFFALAGGTSLILPVATYAGAVFITFVFSTLFWFSRAGEKNSSLEAAGMLSLKELLQVSFPMFLTALLQLLMEYTGVFLLGAFSTANEVGIYSIAVRLAMVTSFILIAVNTIIAPKFAELYWNNRGDDLKNIVSFSSRIIFWSSVPILAVLIAFPHFFMGLFGAEFSGSRAQLSLIILCIGQIVNALSGSVGYFLIMTGGQRVFRNIVFFSALLNILLNVVLIPRLGMIGASLATTSSLICWNITSLLYIRAKYGINTFYLPLLGRRLEAAQ